MKPCLGHSLIDDTSTNSLVTYQADFLSKVEADALFLMMQRDAPFVAESPVMFGQPKPVSRASCAFGAEGVSYRYSGLLRQAEVWPLYLQPIKERLENATGASFNFALCNLYPDGAA